MHNASPFPCPPLFNCGFKTLDPNQFRGRSRLGLMQGLGSGTRSGWWEEVQFLRDTVLIKMEPRVFLSARMGAERGIWGALEAAIAKRAAVFLF